MHRWTWLGLCVCLLCGTAGCLGEAPRGNPLDPLAENFEDEGQLRGRVTSWYPPFEGLGDVEVRLAPGFFVTRTASDGSFAFDAVPTGAYTVTVAGEAYAETILTDTVRLGQATTVDVRLNGRPAVTEADLNTVHLSRWWPQTDLYALDVEAVVTDPDGVGDVATVWLEVPSLGVLDTLRATRDPDRFTLSLEAADLPTGSLHTLLGRDLMLHVRDRVGAASTPAPRTLARVIDEVPVATSPQGLEPVDTATPTLTWERLRLPYPFTYEVEIVRVEETNIQTTVAVLGPIAPDATSAVVSEALPPGTYLWTVSVLDEYGNRSRSKEAGFLIP